MNPTQNNDPSVEIHEEQKSSGDGKKLGDFIPIYIPAIEMGLLNSSRHDKKPRFLDFLRARPSNEWFLKVLRRDSGDNAADHRRRRRFRVPFVRKIKWGALWILFKKWIRSPKHIAVFIWLLFVAAGLILLFMVMSGILDDAIPSSNRRKDWTEIINQILNALFTMMALYEHPRFFHHLILLLRWKSVDEVVLRKVYVKNGAPKTNERAHMLVVVILLHITCFAQYILCGLYWGFTRKTRPEWGENTSIGVGIVAPITAVLYTLYSPLGRTNDQAMVEEGVSELQNQAATEESELEGFERKIIITSPEWIGGIYDCGDDSTVSLLSLFCTFCVFGWNMERLGFGNMYVHMITFILLCVAPFWIFAISALNVEDDTIKLILVIFGGVLCLFGLFYGGFWRGKMREKFKLPGNPLCCGVAGITDYMQWLFCWACSLAQEVRTANFYDIEDDGFYRQAVDGDGRFVMTQLPREGSLNVMESLERSRSTPAATLFMNGRSTSNGVELQARFGRAMTAPSPSLMRVEEKPLRGLNLNNEEQFSNVDLEEK